MEENSRHDALQKFNTDILKCIEDLCIKRDDVYQQILTETEDKEKLQDDIKVLTDRLARVNENLAEKLVLRNEFDKRIAETEAAYSKILISSQKLVNSVTSWRKRPVTEGHQRPKTGSK